VFPDVPPGEYLIVALEDAEPGEWSNPERLESLAPASTAITVEPDDRQEVDVGLR
jgi:hypothetical protein